MEKFASAAALYTTDLVHLMDLNVVGAVGLWGVDCNNEVLFMTDKAASKIHVMWENGSYVHNITVNWQPFGLDVYGEHLFVTDVAGDKLYKIQLDQAYNRVGIDQVILSAPVMDSPNFVYVSSDKILVSNNYNLVVSDWAGTVEWTYGTGTAGSADGELSSAQGVKMDRWGRVFVADYLNVRVPLVSADGTFIKNLATGMDGKPHDVLLVGDTLYVSEIALSKLIKYTINYASLPSASISTTTEGTCFYHSSNASIKHQNILEKVSFMIVTLHKAHVCLALFVKAP